jgi:flap endonuclease-1
MGIQNLNKFLKDKNVNCFFKIPLGKFGGYRIAIDGLNWIFSYISIVNKNLIERQKDILEDITQESMYEGMLLEWIKFNNKLMNYKITPVWIWDGVSKDNKLVTKVERRKIRDEYKRKKLGLREELLKLPILARDESMLKEYKKLLMLTPYFSFDNIENIKKFATTIGIPSITADDEAENLASSLGVELKVAAVWSSDTDTYPLGAPVVVKGFENIGGTVNIKGVFTLNILRDLGLNHIEFRDFCILLGTDFNDRMDRIGPVNSLMLIKKYRNIETIAAETKNNTYCLKQDEVREQLTPYETFITSEQLDSKLNKDEYPFGDDKYRSFYIDLLNNVRDLGPSNNLPKFKKK